MSAYYNEFDPKAAAWLRELIKQGHIADGEVDTRSIEDVTPDDLRKFTQCHFFAGIGVWSYALRRAGWPDDRPVWTGSCPCQPFSAAGKGAGEKDERHLWPAFYRLIRARRPGVVFGEQVASAIVTGKFTGEGMLSLWQTRQLLNLRKDWLEGFTSVDLQGLQEFVRQSSERRSPGEHSNPSQPTCSGSKEPSEQTRHAIRSGCGVGDRAAGSGDLPIERETLRPFGISGVCNAVTGQDQSEGWIHEAEHQGDPVRAECGARNVGRGETVRCGDGVDQDSIESLNDLVEEIGLDIAAENGNSWLNALQLDLDRIGYTSGACVTAAAGFGAPHIRQRIFFVGNALDSGRQSESNVGGSAGSRMEQGGRKQIELSEAGGELGILADADGGNSSAERKQRSGQHGQQPQDGSVGVALGDTEPTRLEGHGGNVGNGNQPGRHGAHAAGSATTSSAVDNVAHPLHAGRPERWPESGSGSAAGGDGVGELADTDGGNPGAEGLQRSGQHGQQPQDGGATRGFWHPADWLPCRDGKWRPVEPGTFPLAHGAPARVGRLRGYGNAIVAPVAQGFIEAYLDI